MNAFLNFYSHCFYLAEHTERQSVRMCSLIFVILQGNPTEINAKMRLNKTGDVMYVRELIVTIQCQMNLQKYPLDVER